MNNETYKGYAIKVLERSLAGKDKVIEVSTRIANKSLNEKGNTKWEALAKIKIKMNAELDRINLRRIN